MIWQVAIELPKKYLALQQLEIRKTNDLVSRTYLKVIHGAN
jgi:hypothetical protein